VAGVEVATATIDGEAVWCDGEGLAIFEKLHSRACDGQAILYAFDLLLKALRDARALVDEIEAD
jgi:ATP-dependent DNA ligase